MKNFFPLKEKKRCGWCLTTKIKKNKIKLLAVESKKGVLLSTAELPFCK